MVGDRLALLTSPCQSRARPSAYDGPAGRTVIDGGNSPGPADALVACGGIIGCDVGRPAVRPADPGLLAAPPGKTLARGALWRAGTPPVARRLAAGRLWR